VTVVTTATFWRVVGMIRAYGDSEAARLLHVTKQELLGGIHGGAEPEVVARVERHIRERYRDRAPSMSVRMYYEMP
jgi:hypothetical protein